MAKNYCNIECLSCSGTNWWFDAEEFSEPEDDVKKCECGKKCDQKNCKCKESKKIPKNNDDQDVCYWCGGELKNIDTGMLYPMKICKKCGK